MRRCLVLLLLILGSQSSFAFPIDIIRDVSYSSSDSITPEKRLDIYYPQTPSKAQNVMVFFHGGSWNSGKKETYWWLGRNMAHKGVVTIIINYSLSPVHQYEKMAADCAEALKWVSSNVNTYGGDPQRIFVMGHSAGGHLAALINSDTRFFKEQQIENPIRGLILNDAFGLDMFEYLTSAEKDSRTDSFLNTFSTNQETWKKGSPMYYVKDLQVPVLMFVGERTYPAIQIQSERLQKELTALNRKTELKIIPKKKHVQMIAQMIFKGNNLYDYILEFMANQA